MVMAANFGMPVAKNTSAPEFFNDTNCESTVGSVTSYVAVATISLSA